MKLPIGIGLLLVFAVGFDEFVLAENTVWGYECKKNVCVKVDITDKVESAISLPVCRMFCGEEGVGTLWPKPTVATRIDDQLLHIDEFSMQFEMPKFKSQSTLWSGIEQRFKEQLKSKVPAGMSMKSSEKKINVNVEVEQESLDFAFGTDESYTLKIDAANGIKIVAPTFYGARHAVETLAQLIVFDDIRSELLIVYSVEITDKPAFQYRGLLLDTARNYFSVKSIKRTLDGMAMVKLNTFHWHITDSQSFPLHLTSQPDLVKYGAYTKSQIYTAADVASIVEYGRIRGIRVIPEFDAPAHVGEGWQKKGLTACFNYQPWTKYCVEPPCGQLDPSKPELYNVLEDIYREMFTMFEQPPFFHMGGDEVSVSCWNTSADIQKFMLNNNWQLEEVDFMKLWNHFQENALARVDKVSQKKLPIVMWTSKLTDVPQLEAYLDKERYIIQTWTTGDDPKLTEILKRGYKMILSNYDALYLDCGFAGWVNSGQNWCSPYIGWQKVYDNSPARIAGKYLPQILGAESALWTEQVDEYTLDSRLWPRLSAMAERLWSDPDSTWRSAESRMLVHRERLVQNGIGAEAIQPQWCLQNEGECPIGV